MAAQGQAPNVDLFDAYFRRADMDRDGRISGAEAVAFFQGSGLPQHVLAQIWVHADQNRIGFLGRAEFYNALRLVTVAQSKRELTPDIVKAALYGPASAKIPAPQINLGLLPAPQMNSAPAAPASQMGAVGPAASQNLGLRGPQMPPNATMNQQYTPRPPQALSGPALRPTQGVAFQGLPGGGPVTGPQLPNSSMSREWVTERTGGTPVGTTSQISNRGISHSASQDGFGLAASGMTASRPPRPQATLGMIPSQPPAKDSKAPDVSGNGFASHSLFGRDVFSATPSQTKQDSSASTFSAGNIPVSSSVVPVSNVTQPSAKPSSLETLQSSLTMQPVGGQIQQTQSLMKQNQQVPTQGTSAFGSSGISLSAENSASNQAQLPWPKMTQSDVQKYTKVFVEVDTDRDGKITGEEARNLFLSWRLPREVLKQVWDLSDQDNDSMLSLREFCTALYLMERYREGRPLPAVLPSNIMLDFPTTGQPSLGYGNAAWGPTPGLQQPRGISGPSPQQVTPATGARPPVPLAVRQANEEMQTNQPKSRVPVLEKHLLDQLSKEEQNSLNSKFQEAKEADKKVEELEKEILDSREKIEFCRTKMQELVLYKSRCDNRVNEITERASADKREVESLAKKYEEKCKQVGDIASKLTMEEATFRDIQERKIELYQAIVKMEQDGSTDGILQVRADRIQSDLDELVKSLNERCKKYGLRARPTALAELPFGWQPGIQEGAADWDEDWDKFEDEGFTFVKELTLDVQNVIAPPKPKSIVRKEKASIVESPTVASSDADVKSEKPPTMGEQVHENGSAFNKNEDDSAKSGQGSPVAGSAMESPSREFADSHFEKTMSADASPRVKETQSYQGGAESFLSGDKNFDEPIWGTFDGNDDVDSVWGLNPDTNSKEPDHESQRENYFFGSGDLGLNPIRTESPQADSIFQRKSPFAFADSVPSTPAYSTANSPPRYSEASEHSFDNFQRFDSFSTHESSFFQPRDTFARFDSMRSTNDFDHGRETFARFDSMRSTNDFDHGRETFARFDSMRSTNDFDHGHGFPSFDDSDPFGSTGPFKTSLESQTPRRGSDNWSAF